MKLFCWRPPTEWPKGRYPRIEPILPESIYVTPNTERFIKVPNHRDAFLEKKATGTTNGRRQGNPVSLPAFSALSLSAFRETLFAGDSKRPTTPIPASLCSRVVGEFRSRNLFPRELMVNGLRLHNKSPRQPSNPRSLWLEHRNRRRVIDPRPRSHSLDPRGQSSLNQYHRLPVAPPSTIAASHCESQSRLASLCRHQARSEAAAGRRVPIASSPSSPRQRIPPFETLLVRLGPSAGGNCRGHWFVGHFFTTDAEAVAILLRLAEEELFGH
jgi:hypothetical protein